MDAIVAQSSALLKAQRQRGTASLQAPSQALVNNFLAAITVNSTRGASNNRFSKYAAFCEAENIPTFPIVGDIVALQLYDLAGGDPDTGKAYDSHTTVINAIRKHTLHLWEGRAGCETASISITHNAGVKEFCGVARLSAANKKRDKDVDVLSPSKSPASSTSKMSIASPRTPSTTTGRTMTLSTPKSRKRSTVDSPSREAVAATPSSRQKTSAASTTPASKKRKTESTPEGARSPASVDAPNSGRRSGRSSLATAGVTSPLAKGLESSRRSARAKVTAADVGNKSAKVKAVEADQAKPVQVPASDEGMDLVSEVESGAAVEETDVEITEGPEGVGMFGRIVRWFGFGQ